MQNDIQRRAYELWEADGRPEGQDQSYWFKAVAELTQAATASIKPPRKRTTRVRKAA